MATSKTSYAALQSGVCISKTTISKANTTIIRRIFASLISNRSNAHHSIPLLIESFWTMILAPTTHASSIHFNHTVRSRCKLFEAGRWESLWDGVTFHNSNHRHQPSHPNVLEDPLDAQAARMQHQITRFGSVSGASRTLKSPLAPPSSNLLKTFQALHPQIGDNVPSPIPPPGISNLTPQSPFDVLHSTTRRPIFDPNQTLPRNDATTVSFTTEEYMKKLEEAMPLYYFLMRSSRHYRDVL
jgi:hypothetical protein